jgi:hypothetical protein
MLIDELIVYAVASSPICATCSAHVILRHLTSCYLLSVTTRIRECIKNFAIPNSALPQFLLSRYVRQVLLAYDVDVW